MQNGRRHTHFNSTMVRLKAVDEKVLKVVYQYFNSTMVRLKEENEKTGDPT